MVLKLVLYDNNENRFNTARALSGSEKTQPLDFIRFCYYSITLLVNSALSFILRTGQGSDVCDHPGTVEPPPSPQTEEICCDQSFVNVPAVPGYGYVS